MKSKNCVGIILLAAFTAAARIIVPFQNWSQVEQESPSIVIARCGEPTPPTPGVINVNGTRSDSSIEVVYVLKGTNALGVSRLLTDHELQKGEKYLIFGNFDGQAYQAYEEYRVIALGSGFHTNSLSEKSLDQQLHSLFQRRVNNLNQQMKSEQEEKQRLEEALKE